MTIHQHFSWRKLQEDSPKYYQQHQTNMCYNQIGYIKGMQGESNTSKSTYIIQNIIAIKGSRWNMFLLEWEEPTKGICGTMARALWVNKREELLWCTIDCKLDIRRGEWRQEGQGKINGNQKIQICRDYKLVGERIIRISKAGKKEVLIIMKCFRWGFQIVV